MNLDRIAIDVEARLAAESTIGSAFVALNERTGELTVGFDRTDGLQLASFSTPVERRGLSHEDIVATAARRLLDMARSFDAPSNATSPERA